MQRLESKIAIKAFNRLSSHLQEELCSAAKLRVHLGNMPLAYHRSAINTVWWFMYGRKQNWNIVGTRKQVWRAFKYQVYVMRICKHVGK